ncbi:MULTISPECIES: STAS domain-containing protein [unclassified Kitasatospora]|uniref:STAS domain-containing protein n=1 Tax=unclassified Kitasatospora TaxID=2633591 RepID=UPI0034114650
MNTEGDDRTADRPAPAAPVVARQGSVVTRLEGDLDLDHADAARAVLAEALASPAGVVVIDLESVGFCDSSGLNLLLQTRLTLQEAGRTLRLAAVPAQVTRLLEITGASEVFHLYADAADALEGP